MSFNLFPPQPKQDNSIWGAVRGQYAQDQFDRQRALFNPSAYQNRPTFFGNLYPDTHINPYYTTTATQQSSYQPQYQQQNLSDQQWGQQMNAIFSQDQQSRTKSLFYGRRPSKKNKRPSKKNKRPSKKNKRPSKKNKRLSKY